MALDLSGLSQDEQFKKAAAYARVPEAVLRGQWKAESSEGTNMRSPAGARGHFGLMPATQATWEKRTGRTYDPDKFDDALTMAALTMRENMQATKGDIVDALKMYNNGTDRSRWGAQETVEYPHKVLGTSAGAESSTTSVRSNKMGDVNAAWRGDPIDDSRSTAEGSGGVKPKLSDVEEGLVNMVVRQAAANAEIEGKDGLEAARGAEAVAHEVARELPEAAVESFSTEEIDTTDDSIANDARVAAIDAAEAEETRKAQWTNTDMFGAAFDSNITAGVLRWMDSEYMKTSAVPMTDWYLENIGKIERPGDTDEERATLRQATSQEQADAARARISERQYAAQVLTDAGPVAGTMWGLTGTLADPAGLVASYGLGKVAQVAKVGAASYAAQGRPVATLVAGGAEGGVGSILADGALVALGEHRSAEDFINDAGAGILFGTAFNIGTFKRAKEVELANAYIKDSNARNAALIVKAQAEAGPGATPEKLKEVMDRMEYEEDTKWLKHILGDSVDADRLMARPDVGAERPAAPEPVVVPDTFVAVVKDDVEHTLKITRGSTAGDESITVEVVDAEGNPAKDSLGRDVGRVIASPTGGKLSVNVSPEFQRQGIATALYRVARDAGADLGDEAGNFAGGGTATRSDMGQAFRSGADLDSANVRPATKAAPKPKYPVNTLLDSKKKRAAIVDKYGLKERISDDAERIQVAEIIARSERILKNNNIDSVRLATIMQKLDLEATSTTMMSDPSPVSKAVGVMLMENPEGAAGRHRTAALTRDIQFQQYLGNTGPEYTHHYTQWRAANKVSNIADFLDNNQARRRFDRQVAIERDARFNEKGPTTNDKFVLAAADVWDKSYNQMAAHQRVSGVIGFERLPEGPVAGYAPRAWDLHRIVELSTNPVKRSAFLRAIQAEFEDIAGFTAGEDDFTRALAIKYLERLELRAAGGDSVPTNLYSSDTADILRDSLRALSLSEEDIQKAVGRYGRGGAKHTKSRIDMDLTRQHDDGAGGRFQLIDFIDNNHVAIHRRYASRVAGDVALSKYGVMGNAGALELRKAMQQTGATEKALRAYDQFMSEMMGRPFETADSKWLVNARILTGATRLGGALFPQLGTYADSVAAVGVEGALKAMGGIPRLHAEIRAKLRGETIENGVLDGLETLGMEFGVADYRLIGMFDVEEITALYGRETVGIVDRALRASGNAVRILSGHRALTAVQTRGMAEQVVQKAWKFIKSGADDKALDDMGINPALRARLREQMDKVVEWDAQGNVQVFDPRRGDPEYGADFVQFRDAVHRGASQIVQREFAGEVGKWAHNGLLKTLFQFRTFSLIAQQKQLGRISGVHGNAKAAAYILGAASFAIPIHSARVLIRASLMPEDAREEFLSEQLSPLTLGRATMNYVAALGILPDALDIGGGLGTSWAKSFGMELPDGVKPTGGRTMSNADVIGGQFAPAIGVINDLGQGLSGNKAKLIRSLPGANLPYIQPAWLGVEERLKD